jgi:hypothetical protein
MIPAIIAARAATAQPRARAGSTRRNNANARTARLLLLALRAAPESTAS